MAELSIFNLLIVLAVILFFFGGRRIPETMRWFGEEIFRRQQQQLQQPRPLRFSRGETHWQALIRLLRRLLSKR